MGFFDFFKRGDKKEPQILDSFKKNIKQWGIEDKALLLAILIEIAWADGQMDETERATIAKIGFGAGILDDIMEVQDLAGVLYSKGDVFDPDKIANDFNSLGSDKKEYIIKSLSEMMEADGTVSSREIAMAKKLTGR